MKINRSRVNDHHCIVTVEDTKTPPRTLRNSNRYNSTCKNATRSLYEERGSTSKNACIISDGGKIISKSSSNTFYHGNNNANRQQHQQQYIKHALSKNSPNKTKYETRCNISNSSDEDNTRRHSYNRYFNAANNVAKDDPLPSCTLPLNADTGLIEDEGYRSTNPDRNHSYGIYKTSRKRGNSCDNSVKTPHSKSVPHVDKKRSTSVGVFCDYDCTGNVSCENGKETGFITILKINDSEPIDVKKNIKLLNRKEDEYSSRRPNETTIKSNCSPVLNVSINETQPNGSHKIPKQYQDTLKPFSVSNSKQSQTKVKNDGSVLVQVKDPSVTQKRPSLVDFKNRQRESNNHDYYSLQNSSEYTQEDDLVSVKKSSRSNSTLLSSKTGEVTKDIKRVQSNLSKPTKSSVLKRHSSICSGDLNTNRGKNIVPIFSADRRLSVDKAIQCRVASSSSFKFRSLVSIFLNIFV